MSKSRGSPRPCAVCGRSFAPRDLVSGGLVHDRVSEEIRAEHPQWSRESFICRPDISRFRAQHVRSMLESEKGELSSLDQSVLASLREHEVLAKNIEAEFERDPSLGNRLADKLAATGGSWPFLIAFGVFLLFWIGMNSLVLWIRPVDPYPFILLNLLLSCLAAIQAPVIMMSQNRQGQKDRLRSQHDYEVNLKAELEIRHLHEKIDHLLTHQWERLFEIQEIQIELLQDMGRRA